MNAHQRLERQLRDSIVNGADRRPAMWSGLRVWARGIPVLIVASITTVAVAAAAVTVVLTRPPAPGAIPPNVDFSVVAAAINSTGADPACSTVSNTTQPTDAAPSREMLATLPILRAPATSADRGLARGYGLGGEESLPGGGGVFVRYIRQARVADGITFTLIPGEIGRRPLSQVAANRCYRIAITTLDARLPSLPVAKRDATRRYAHTLINYRRYNLETSKPDQDAVFVNATGGTFGDSDVQKLSVIRTSGMLGQTNSVWWGIVPPGVATVTLKFAARSDGNHRGTPLNATGDVINSVFAINIPSNPTGAGWPTSATWRTNTGHLIKTINEQPLRP